MDALGPGTILARTLAQFLHRTYRAAADLGGWDRASLEDDPARWPQHGPGRRAAHRPAVEGSR